MAKPTLSANDRPTVYRVAGEASCDPRTVRSFAKNRKRVSKLAAKAIELACERLRISIPSSKGAA